MNITVVAGARPNFMKIAPLSHAVDRYNRESDRKINMRVVYTGTSDEAWLGGTLFEDLNISRPDAYLNVSGDTLNRLAAGIMTSFEKDLRDNHADVVVVVDDFTSTMACAIVAKKMSVKVAHLVAGTRSFDMSMPKEVNRMITDGLSDILFVGGYSAAYNLRISGTVMEHIHMVGNILMDTLRENIDKVKRPAVLDEVKDRFLLLTLNRKVMTGNKELLARVMKEIVAAAGDVDIVAPLHDYVRAAVREVIDVPANLHIVPPLGYLEFLYLERHAAGIITDSGNVAEEATFLGVPCITLSGYTEHKETVNTGSNELGCDDPALIGELTGRMVEGKWKKSSIPERWDGHTADRIVCILAGEADE